MGVIIVGWGQPKTCKLVFAVSPLFGQEKVPYHLTLGELIEIQLVHSLVGVADTRCIIYTVVKVHVLLLKKKTNKKNNGMKR